MGGDYYDVISMSESKLAVAVADVSGKGAAAAMLMAALQSSLGTLLKEDLPVAETVRRLNRALCDRMPDATFITFFLAFINSVSGRIQYCCAGHDPPILCTGTGPDSLAQLDCGGLILGVKSDAVYSMAEMDVPQGSRLLLYTDGVTETMTADDEPFGIHRLNMFLQKHCCETAESLLEKLTSLLEHFRGEIDQQDDVTALVIARGIFRE
jgi:sigma-B regulation protein RsbU (phosphoserine phosphatase)